MRTPSSEESGRFGRWLLERPESPGDLFAGADSIDLRFISGRAALLAGRVFEAMPASVRTVRLLLHDPQSPLLAGYDRAVPVGTEPSWVAIQQTLAALARAGHLWRSKGITLECRLYDMAVPGTLLMALVDGQAIRACLEPYFCGVDAMSRVNLIMDAPDDAPILNLFATDFDTCWAGSRPYRL